MSRAWLPRQRSKGDSPGPRQQPFGLGQSALSVGLCLSRAFRRTAFASRTFLCPLRFWAVLPKMVGLTGVCRTATGLPRFAPGRSVGGGCLLYCGAEVSATASMSEDAFSCGPLSSCQPSFSATCTDAASSKIHSRSPVPTFPCPTRPDGSELSWASTVCCRTARYRDACAVWEPARTHAGIVDYSRPLH